MSTTLQAASTTALNAGQQAAADGFFDFLFSDNRELCISGPGGTGKTFLMGHLIDQVLPQYHQTCQVLGINPIYTDVVMTATTNKAADVLSWATLRPTKTTHSYFGLRVQQDFTNGSTKIVKTDRWQVKYNTVIFIDESSMVDSTLRKFIHEGTVNCKIVYVGDHCQLSPVKERLSPIYRDNLPFFELTEPMRTNNPHLQAINDQLRDTVKTGVFRPIQVVPGVIDWLDGPAMEQEIQQHFKDLETNDRIVAYTNKQVVAYNDYIRHLRGLPPTLTVGERVINNSNVQRGSSTTLQTDEEFTVTAVAPTTEKILIDVDTELEVLRCALRNDYKHVSNVLIPVNREHHQALLKHYKQQKNWLKYYELLNNYPDLRPRDACTVHKAQGSTCDTVFIDVGNLSTCRDPAVAARLLYVAFSRARHRVVMYGNLAPKFGGIVR